MRNSRLHTGMAMRRSVKSAILVLVLIFCVSCGKGTDTPTRADDGINSEIFVGDADVYKYNNEIDMSIKHVKNDFLVEVLRDGTITADEMNELYRRTVNCYHNRGFEFTYYPETLGASVGRIDGQSIMINHDELENVNQQCNTDSGFEILSNIYFEATRNPEHLDLAPYTVQCFIDHKLVGPQYSVADYMRDAQMRTGPYKIQDEDPEGAQGLQVTQCGRDPLGKLE